MNISTNNGSMASLNYSGYNMTSHTTQFPVKAIVEISLHIVIFILGTIGNILIIAVITRYQSMHTATNWFVFNLAISDLCLTIFNIPLANIYHFTGWPFGKFLCKYFLGAFGECIVGVSVFTHTALGLVRHHVVLNPLRSKIRLRNVRIAIVFIWAFSYASLSAPINGKFQLVYSKNIEGFVCKPAWPSLNYRLAYRGCVFAITYIIPMVIATFCYVRIFSALKQSMRFLASGSAATHTQMKKREFKSKRLTKALYIIYTIFALTTLPLEIFYVLADSNALPGNARMAHVWSILLACFYSLSVVNPLMLFYMSEDYRNQLKHLLFTKRCCAKRRKSSGFSRWTKSSRHDSNTQHVTFSNNTRRDSRKSAQKATRLECNNLECNQLESKRHECNKLEYKSQQRNNLECGGCKKPECNVLECSKQVCNDLEYKRLECRRQGCKRYESNESKCSKLECNVLECSKQGCNDLECNRAVCRRQDCKRYECNKHKCSKLECNELECNKFERNKPKNHNLEYNKLECNKQTCNKLECNTVEYNMIEGNVIECKKFECNMLECNMLECKMIENNMLQCHRIENNMLECNRAEINETDVASSNATESQQLLHQCKRETLV